MTGRSFMLATRMPMSRSGFDAWLAEPLPGLDIIDNPAAFLAAAEAADEAGGKAADKAGGWDPDGLLDPAVGNGMR